MSLTDIAIAYCTNPEASCYGHAYAAELDACPRCGHAPVKPVSRSRPDHSKSRLSALEALFLARFEQLAPQLPEPEREYYFDTDRNWRFDFAWPQSMIAVEVQGGQWIKGGHTTGQGLQRDAEKNNAAVLVGWSILYFTGDMIRNNPQYCIDTILDLFEQEA